MRIAASSAAAFHGPALTPCANRLATPAETSGRFPEATSRAAPTVAAASDEDTAAPLTPAVSSAADSVNPRRSSRPRSARGPLRGGA